MSELNRLRWRARRGMLELDILLLDFLERHYSILSPELQTAFGELLEQDDYALWGMIQGDLPGVCSGQMQIIERLRTGKTNEGTH